jgi:hypothetical protein
VSVIGQDGRLNARWDFAEHGEGLIDRPHFVSGSTGACRETGAPRTFSFRAGCHF